MKLPPNELESILQSLRGLMHAAATTRRGVWTQNFLPALAPVEARLCSRENIKRIVDALREKATQSNEFGELLTASKQRYLEALRTYLTASLSDIAATAMTAIAAGAELIALIGMLSIPTAEDDLRAFGRGLKAVANRRTLTPAEGQEILRLRQTLDADETNLLARDRLFDLESR